MTTRDVHERNKRDAERGLSYLDPMDGYGRIRCAGYPVVRHALESIVKRCLQELKGGEETDSPVS